MTVTCLKVVAQIYLGKIKMKLQQTLVLDGLFYATFLSLVGSVIRLRRFE